MQKKAKSFIRQTGSFLSRKNTKDWLNISVVIITAFVMIWQGYLLKDTMVDARNNAERQLSLMEADQRPWVEIESGKVEEIKLIDKDLVNIRFKLILKNVGKTPALYVSPVSKVEVMTFENLKKILAPPRILCTPSSERLKVGTTLFPDKTGDVGFSTGLLWRDISLPEATTIPPTSIVLYGCIDYWYSSAIKHGQTGFFFYVDKSGPDGKRHPLPKAIGDINPNDLVMTEDTFGRYAE